MLLVKHLLLTLLPWAGKHCRWSGMNSHSERSQDWYVKLHSANACMKADDGHFEYRRIVYFVAQVTADFLCHITIEGVSAKTRQVELSVSCNKRLKWYRLIEIHNICQYGGVPVINKGGSSVLIPGKLTWQWTSVGLVWYMLSCSHCNLADSEQIQVNSSCTVLYNNLLCP